MSTFKIHTSSVGLAGKDVYVAHENGDWGPEQPGDYMNHEMSRAENSSFFEIDGSFLEAREEFKLVIPVKNETEARQIYGERMARGVHIGTRFDFDSNYNTLWLLASSHPVVRPGEWNQNNIFV